MGSARATKLLPSGRKSRRSSLTPFDVSPARRSFDLRLRLCALSLVRRRAGRTGASGRRCALPRQGQAGLAARRCSTHEPDARCRGRLRGRLSSRGRRIGGRRPLSPGRRLREPNGGFESLACLDGRRTRFASSPGIERRSHGERTRTRGAGRSRRKLALGRERRTIAAR